MPKKHFVPDREFAFANDSFRLVSESSLDGDRLAAELQQQIQDREHSAHNQLELCPQQNPKHNPPAKNP